MRDIQISITREDGRGQSNPVFSIGGASRWHLAQDGLEGFDSVPVTVSTQAYAQYDGSYLMAERASELDRTICAFAGGDLASLRAQAEAFFIPRREYRVSVTAEGRSRFFRARHYAMALTVDNFRDVQRLEWTCLALDPYLYSEESNSFNIVEGRAKRGFPFVSFARRVAPEPMLRIAPEPETHIAGMVASVVSRTLKMRNSGSTTTYPRFDITASGEVRDPSVSITDSTGVEVCRFGVKVSMRAGDVLTVDFSTRPTLITLNGRNVSNLAKPGSTLATGIEPGDFDLSWSAAFGDAAMSVVPTIRNRYASL